MAYMLKNRVFGTQSYALGLPVGTDTIRPQSPVDGQVYWNEQSQKLQYFFGGNVYNVAHEGQATIVNDNFTGNANIATYGPMSYTYNSGQEAQVLVFNGTVFQVPGTNYTFNGTANITFLGSVSDGATITVLHNFASTIAA